MFDVTEIPSIIFYVNLILGFKYKVYIVLSLFHSTHSEV